MLPMEIFARILLIISGIALILSFFIEKYKRSVMVVIMCIIAYILFRAVDVLLNKKALNIADSIIVSMLSGYAALVFIEKNKHKTKEPLVHRSAFDEGH